MAQVRQPLDIDDVIMEIKKALSERENKMSIVRVEAGSSTLLAEIDNYYILPELSTAGQGIAVTLPIIENTKSVSGIMFLVNVTNGTVSFNTPQNSVPIYYQEGFDVNSGTYEVNALFNGEFWSLTSTKISEG